MVQLGVLRFTKIDGKKCLVVLDEENRAAEIRALDRTLFYSKSKAYPLKGVDKGLVDWGCCSAGGSKRYLDSIVRRRN